MIFFKSATFYLILLGLSLVFFTQWLFVRTGDRLTTFELSQDSSKDSPFVQEREKVVREVFLERGEKPVVVLKCGKSFIEWDQSLKEEMFDLEGSFGDDISFSSKSLVWNREKNEAVLKGDCRLVFDSEITVEAVDRVVVTFNDQGVSKIESTGDTTFDLSSGFTEGSSLKVICSGTSTLDPNKGELTLLSPQEGKPIHLVENKFHIIGNSLTYSLDTHELYLQGRDESRVLVSDREHEFEMSADAVRFKKTTPVQKGYIQGVGDVRFLLGIKEKEHLLKLFSSIGE